MAQTTLINDIYGVVGSQGEITDLNADGKNMGLVRATTGPGGRIPIFSAEALRRRPVYPKNLVNPTQAYGLVQTLGTVTDAPGVTHTMIAAATESGTTARIFGSITLTLDTSKYYEISVRVDAVSLSNQAAMRRGWFGLSVAPSEGTQQLLFGVQNPVVASASQSESSQLPRARSCGWGSGSITARP